MPCELIILLLLYVLHCPLTVLSVDSLLFKWTKCSTERSCKHRTDLLQLILHESRISDFGVEMGKVVKLSPEKRIEAVVDIMRESGISAKNGVMALPLIEK